MQSNQTSTYRDILGATRHDWPRSRPIFSARAFLFPRRRCLRGRGPGDLEVVLSLRSSIFRERCCRGAVVRFLHVSWSAALRSDRARLRFRRGRQPKQLCRRITAIAIAQLPFRSEEGARRARTSRERGVSASRSAPPRNADGRFRNALRARVDIRGRAIFRLFGVFSRFLLGGVFPGKRWGVEIHLLRELWSGAGRLFGQWAELR